MSPARRCKAHVVCHLRRAAHQRVRASRQASRACAVCAQHARMLAHSHSPARRQPGKRRVGAVFARLYRAPRRRSRVHWRLRQRYPTMCMQNRPPAADSMSRRTHQVHGTPTPEPCRCGRHRSRRPRCCRSLCRRPCRRACPLCARTAEAAARHRPGSWARRRCRAMCTTARAKGATYPTLPRVPTRACTHLRFIGARTRRRPRA